MFNQQQQLSHSNLTGLNDGKNDFQQQQNNKSKSMNQMNNNNNTFSNMETQENGNGNKGYGKESLEQKLKRQQQLTEVIIQMLEYLTRNVFKKNTQDLFEFKNTVKGLSKEELLIFDHLVQKYLYSNKTKEEKIKFILRKCFKTLKGKLEQQDALSSSKEIEEQFYQKYFNQVNGLTDKEIQRLQSQGEFMPFKKDSKFKTMNSTFLKKVFNSPQFYQDYHDFLNNFDKIAEKENKIKIEKCAAAIYEMVEKREINKIKNYKRLPWAWKWIEQTKAQAQKLIGFGSENSTDSPISSLQSFDLKKGSSSPNQQSLSDKKFASVGELLNSKEEQQQQNQNQVQQHSQSLQNLGNNYGKKTPEQMTQTLDFNSNNQGQTQTQEQQQQDQKNESSERKNKQEEKQENSNNQQVQEISSQDLKEKLDNLQNLAGAEKMESEISIQQNKDQNQEQQQGQEQLKEELQEKNSRENLKKSNDKFEREGEELQRLDLKNQLIKQ
ncbi:hypothetical protein PPERSA_11646 [Pseudocohnilembus persalinus]|uniref:Uncharacterized protein n=1 Tax=Pseudocohnilembus persalinus TaxID=266149 RepID=A0A0V0QA28_PSEPJ|nr:hypothetical protein PPERSA_11646 [Pseudocohnilembus persalinus]|eukprot:KRW99045.1 hypothetical protein PPERSA_11646 [Pseudocohnilembus persalinus]